MSTPNARLLVVSALAALVVTLCMQAYAVGQAVQARPVSVVTVNLEIVFDRLQARIDADQQLMKMAEDLKAQAREQAAAIEALEDELEAYTAGTDRHDQTMEKLQLASLKYQAFAEFSRRKIDIEKALVLKRIYLSIKQAARAMAEEQDYDVVFVDDSLAEIPNGTETEVRRQISARRMLYANPAIDATDQLVARMNQ